MFLDLVPMANNLLYTLLLYKYNTSYYNKGEVLNYIPPYTFKLFHLPRYCGSFNYISTPTVLIVPSIVSFLFIIYISAIFKLFLLLQGPLKRLSLLESLVQSLPLRISPTFIVIRVVSQFSVLSIGKLLIFFSTAKVYQFQSTILFQCPLQYFPYYRYT